MIKKMIPGFAGLVLASCASGYEPVYSFNEILIVNNSGELIRDVSISAADSGRSFSCANIAPRGICSNRFPRRPYRRQPIRIDWTFGNQSPRTESFVIDVPPTLYTGLVLRGVLEISPEGALSAYFQQENPIK